jgi:hypothetical protein
MPALCLDLHARYQCRHSGACCENWSVPAEPAVVEIVRGRAIRRQDVGGPLFVKSGDSGDEEMWRVARDIRGECVFYDRRAGGLCIIHRDIGENALPSACRHFPRRVLHDTRGSLIALSHFCPTAAAMLLSDGALTVVEAHSPLRLESEMEGLDARNALPPLLRPGLLCDMDGYETWERKGLANFARLDCQYATCVAEFSSATDVIREWKPGTGSLSDFVLAAFDRSQAGACPVWAHDRAIQRVARLTSGSAADDLIVIPHFEEQWNDRIGVNAEKWFDQGMKNYLAARLFGNWIAYQGHGLRSIVEWLRTCAAVVRHFVLQRLITSQVPLDRSVFIESVRSADLLLLHVLDGGSFGRDVASIEQSSQA